MSINSFLNQSISLKVIVVIGGFWLLVATIALFSLFGGIKEGFHAGLVGLGSALNYGYGSSVDYKMGDGVKRSWENNSVADNNASNIAPTTESSMESSIPFSMINDESFNMYSNLEKNEGSPVPLAEGELLIFDKNKFSPECCPSTYSNGNGCLCASPEQMKYLNERGGNRTLNSVY